MKTRHYVVLLLIVCSPFIMGGAGYDNSGCGCSPDNDDYQPVAIESSGQPPTECLTWIDDARREASVGTACPECQTCVIDEAGLQELRQQLAAARAELTQLKTRQSEAAPAQPLQAERRTKVLRTVKVRQGWWLGLYVKKTPGANLAATKECNSLWGKDPKVFPGQSIKICGWQ